MSALVLIVLLSGGVLIGVIVSEAINRSYGRVQAGEVAKAVHDTLYDYERAAGLPVNPAELFDEERALILTEALTGYRLARVPTDDLDTQDVAA